MNFLNKNNKFLSKSNLNGPEIVWPTHPEVKRDDAIAEPMSKFFVESELNESARLDRNITQSIIDTHSREALRAREDLILDAVRKHGYDIDRGRPAELEMFFKTRCRTIGFTDSDKKILLVDNLPVCEWWDTSRIVNEGNKMIMICGEAPK